MRRPAARAWECALLFGALPPVLAVAPRCAPIERREVVLPALLALGLVLTAALLRDPSFRWRVEARWGAPRAELRRVLARFALCGGALAAAASALAPEAFLALPRQHPGRFALVALVYPAASVLPQEVAYRVWFLRRYAPLFGAGRRAVLASAAAFGWAHVVFWSAPAVALTLAGGWLLGGTFQRTRSLGLVSLEHTLYGLLVFAVGLGRHFHGGTLQALAP